MKKYTIEISIYNNRDTESLSALFTVPLPNRLPVYMSFDLDKRKNDCWALVFVDSLKLLELWRNDAHSIHRKEAIGNPEKWRNDYNFDRAEIGFGKGKTNPVPVAYVSFGICKHIGINYKFLRFGKTITSQDLPCVRFINGVTRTIWLLANYWQSFPIKCELPGANELHKIAGVTDSKVLRISDLIGMTQ